jgi:uncharacterized protein
MMPAPDFLFDGPEDAPLKVALAHGLSVPMDAPFMAFFAEGIAAAGYRVARFEFPYMRERHRSEARIRPDALPVLLDTWRAVVDALGDPSRLVVGGKSLGCRTASVVANELRPAGLLCLGYPFHPPDRQDILRAAHLSDAGVPVLVIQGELDPFGSRNDLRECVFPRDVRFHWLAGGDHNFTPVDGSGRTEVDSWTEALGEVARFLGQLTAGTRAGQEGSQTPRRVPGS